MKLLKIDENLGLFLKKEGGYSTVDNITKDDLLRIMENVLEGSGELDPYSEEEIKNQAHQVVYKSIYSNLKALEERRQEFMDESERLYLEDYKKYVEETAQPNAAHGLA
ncbi:MAG: hypothetical protein KKI01_14620 [Proteobacteria bacterium]|nr:hypothetical protein [Pseudomonadota bacterium]